MKSLLSWIKSHKAVSILVSLTIIAVLVGLRVRSRMQAFGMLSEPIKKGSIIESVYGIGTVMASRSYQLKVGVTSTVKRIYVQEGDHVTQGQKLIDLDGTSFSAPFAGTITNLPTKTGETVFPQALLLGLVDLDDRYIVVSLEQRGLLKVRQGQTAKISFDSLREETFSGVVQSIYSQDNNFLVRIGGSNLPPQILPGMTADVAIGIREKDNVLLIPVSAIELGEVQVKRGGLKPQTISIKTGIIDADKAELESGDIREGEQLFIKKKVRP